MRREQAAAYHRKYPYPGTGIGAERNICRNGQRKSRNVATSDSEAPNIIEPEVKITVET
jgi:hypothetical protein